MAKSTEPTGSGQPQKSNLRRIAECFAAFGVEFIVIDGQAETLMGSPRVTFDVDLCYRQSPENHARQIAALQGLDVRLRNVPAELPFKLDLRTFGFGSNFTFTTNIVDPRLAGLGGAPGQL